MRFAALPLALTVLLAAACAEETPPAPASGEAASAPSLPAPAGAAPSTSSAPALTAEGWGPLRIGMTRDEITAALGPDANPDAVGGADPAQCDQYRPTRAPEGMLVMLEGGRLSRITLTSKTSVTTDRGIAVGAAPDAVLAEYGVAVRSEPHKYEDPPAHYLTVWSKGEGVESSARGIRYEVNGTGKIAAIHAGGPSITYVEGCS